MQFLVLIVCLFILSLVLFLIKISRFSFQLYSFIAGLLMLVENMSELLWKWLKISEALVTHNVMSENRSYFPLIDHVST